MSLPFTADLGLELNVISYGRYSQIGGLPYDGHQLLQVLDDVVSSGAVFIANVMPTNVAFADISEDVANQVASVLEKFTNQGVEVWLRFAHEMNYYSQPDSEGSHYSGGSKFDPPDGSP